MDSNDLEKLFKISKEKREINILISEAAGGEGEADDKMAEFRNRRAPRFLEATYHCECDDESCERVIIVSPDEYAQAHRRERQFIVVPGHVNHERENVIETFYNYAVIEKNN